MEVDYKKKLKDEMKMSIKREIEIIDDYIKQVKGISVDLLMHLSIAIILVLSCYILGIKLFSLGLGLQMLILYLSVTTLYYGMALRTLYFKIVDSRLNLVERVESAIYFD